MSTFLFRFDERKEGNDTSGHAVIYLLSDAGVALAAL